jgi:arylsulfatase
MMPGAAGGLHQIDHVRGDADRAGGADGPVCVTQSANKQFEGGTVSGEPTDVLIAAYLAIDPAKDDYQAVIDAGVKIEGAVCVSRDHAGELHVEETDHMAKKGAEVLGGVGLVVGLFAPPLLLATAVGAALGGGLGELAHHEVESKIEQQAGETIPFGGAGLIVAYLTAANTSFTASRQHIVYRAGG